MRRLESSKRSRLGITKYVAGHLGERDIDAGVADELASELLTTCRDHLLRPCRMHLSNGDSVLLLSAALTME